jgi:hypothetical protein
MRMKRVVVLIAVVSLIMIGTVSPTPARAADAGEFAIYVSAAVVGYVAIVLTATALTRGSRPPWTEAPEDLHVDGKQPRAAMRFGPDCRQRAAELTLICW